MRQDAAWLRWIMTSARSWRDIENVVPETGIDMIDGDHRSLLEFAVALNLLAEDAAQGFTPELLARQRILLSGLLEYTKRHFDREERLIERLGAPNLERQRTEHARIMEALHERSEDFAAGRISVSPDLRRSIFSWIVDHISGTDYATFRLVNLESHFSKAKTWSELRGIIRTTGVDALDAEHRALVDAILAAATALRSASPGFPALMDELARVARDHFAEEEGFLERYGIPGLAVQREAHGKFMTMIESTVNLCSESENLNACASELSRTLIAWIADHVNRLDYESFRRSDWLSRAFETSSIAALLPLVRSTGIALVDSQHLEFIRKATAFSDVLSHAGGLDPAELVIPFDDLIAFAERHFIDEERLFSDSLSAKAGRHAAEHRGILATLRSYRERLADGRLGAASAVRSIVLGWWVNHTNGTDIETFGSFALDAGIDKDE